MSLKVSAKGMLFKQQLLPGVIQPDQEKKEGESLERNEVKNKPKEEKVVGKVSEVVRDESLEKALEKDTKLPKELKEMIRQVQEKVFNLRKEKKKCDVEKKRIDVELESIRIAFSSLGEQFLDPESKEDETLLCPICDERKISVALTPCGHTRCEECALQEVKMNKSCGVCRAEATGTIKLFFN
jgi:hypothetical protein